MCPHHRHLVRIIRVDGSSITTAIGTHSMPLMSLRTHCEYICYAYNHFPKATISVARALPHWVVDMKKQTQHWIFISSPVNQRTAQASCSQPPNKGQKLNIYDWSKKLWPTFATNVTFMLLLHKSLLWCTWYILIILPMYENAIVF